MIWDVYSGSRILDLDFFVPDPGFRGQKAPGSDPQHWLGAYPLAVNACTRNWQLQLYTRAGWEG
jgi:hypothetical protein